VPSSISDSDRRKAGQAILVLLGLLLAYLGALEAAASFGFPRVNHYWRRILADQHDAISICPSATNGSPTTLFIGNSLLEWAVDRDLLHKELSPLYFSSVLPIENTSYLDWFFGLRRLFSEGSRPAAVGVFLSTRQLISEKTMGEPFAHSMMLERDIFAVKHEAHLDNTSASNYFFARSSSWLGYRSEVRNWLLQKLMPNVGDLTRYLPGKTPSMPPTDEVLTRALPRLRTLNELCKQHRVKFFLVVPPTFDVHDSSLALRAAAAREGILVLVPYSPSEMPSEGFQPDGFHLNSHGADLFTRRTALLLLQKLANQPAPVS